MRDRVRRHHARRVFEETLAQVHAQYAPKTDVMLEAVVEDGAGGKVIVAHYKVSTDGRVECFKVLDDVLWPSVEG